MPKATRTALGKQGAAVAQRKRSGGSSPKTRQELYEEAKQHLRHQLLTFGASDIGMMAQAFAETVKRFPVGA